MRTAACLLLCATLSRGALGLRLGRNESEVAELDVDEDAWRYRGVPDIGTFNKFWTKWYRMETHLEEPMPSSIKLILGLMTVAKDGAYRQVVRQTWLQQAGVCYWSLKPQKRCSVYTAFVVGNSSREGGRAAIPEEEQEEGMLVLDTVENMNHGKSFLWFSEALRMFPWATHIGKMDMDTYPFLHKLLHRMSIYRTCTSHDSSYEYMGRFALPRRPHIFANNCSLSDCDTSAGPVEALPIIVGSTYMQGGFYILSRPLVEKINWIQTWGIEDEMMGKTIDRAAGQQQFCVKIRRPEAWVHHLWWGNNRGHEFEFANNFSFA